MSAFHDSAQACHVPLRRCAITPSAIPLARDRARMTSGCDTPTRKPPVISLFHTKRSMPPNSRHDARMASRCSVLAASKGEQMVLDPNVQRAIEGSRAFRKKQRDRLGEITDGGIALLEQPIRNPARLRGPRRETPHRDQPLRSFAAQEVDRPGRVSGRGMREIVNHGVHFLTRASRLVDRSYERGELSHAT